MQPELCWGSFLSCRFVALRGYIVVVSLFIFIKKLKDRHWKEHLFVAAMPGVIEIVGLIASVLDLAGALRRLFTGIYNRASKSFWETSGCIGFVKYLTIVELILRRYKDPVWQEFEAMIMIVQAVKDELEKAWKLVSDSQDTDGWWRSLSADRFAKDLGESQAEIKKYVDLIPAVAANPTAQGAHEHNGNEDLDQDIALSLSFSEEEPREANGKEDSFQVNNDKEMARALQASFDEEMARAFQASLYIDDVN